MALSIIGIYEINDKLLAYNISTQIFMKLANKMLAIWQTILLQTTGSCKNSATAFAQ